MRSLPVKIAIIAIILIIFIVITMFPGIYPLQFLEPIFTTTCSKIMKGEVNKVQRTEFLGIGGIPIRNAYIECGVDPAYDANKICYVAPSPKITFLTDNPLGEATDDECASCQYSWEIIEHDKVILGKKCRPYRLIWRWEYRSPF